MKNIKIGTLILIISSLCIVTPTTHAAKPIPIPAAAVAGNSWIQTKVRGNENVTKLHFYVHDVRSGENATTFAVTDASISSTSSTNFGQIKVYDDLATAEADINSDEVARAQGLATSADLQVRAVSMSLNFFLKSGEFNGSTVSIVGRNQVGNPERELTVVGGTGPFRYARGYALTTTYFDSADYSILEYTVYATYSYSDVQLWTDM